MKLRTCLDCQLSRARWFRLPSLFSAEGKIFLHRSSHFFSEFLHGGTVERNHVVCVDDGSEKGVDFGVKLKGADIAFVLNHGLIPTLKRKRRTVLTAPLSRFGPGCGRWNTATRSFSKTATLDPVRSLMTAPKDSNSDSISCHLILPDMGWAKTA